MQLGHVHLKVSDLNKAEEFYQKVLGLKIIEKINNQFAFLSFGNAHHDLALQAVNKRIEKSSLNVPGLYHVAFEVRDANELLDALHNLESLGLKYSMVDHGISWALYTEDPDGNGIEIYLDRRNNLKIDFWNGESKILSKSEIISEINL